MLSWALLPLQTFFPFPTLLQSSELFVLSHLFFVVVFVLLVVVFCFLFFCFVLLFFLFHQRASSSCPGNSPFLCHAPALDGLLGLQDLNLGSDSQ